VHKPLTTVVRCSYILGVGFDFVSYPAHISPGQVKFLGPISYQNAVRD